MEKKINLKKVFKVVKSILLVAMIVLIYIASPHITAVIQNTAKFLYELEDTYITRVVELLLTFSLITSIFITKEKFKKGE